MLSTFLSGEQKFPAVIVFVEFIEQTQILDRKSLSPQGFRQEVEESIGGCIVAQNSHPMWLCLSWKVVFERDHGSS